MPSGDEAGRLVIEGMSRSFGETRALNTAALSVGRGEIHSLVGENGSGKSTLIKIISGVLQPHSGTLIWQGDARTLSSPGKAHALGIATVFQETLIAPEMTVRDNVYLGTDGLFRYGRRKSEEIAGARQTLNDLGLDKLAPDRPMWTLSLAERQLATVARAIVRPWQLLVLDEATSALDAQQRDRFFEYLKEARSQGKSILFTSHRMDEVLELADRVTVLRLGSTVATMSAGEASRREILGHMSGRAHANGAGTGTVPPAAGQPAGDQQAPVPDLTVPKTTVPDTTRPAAPRPQTVLRVEDLTLRPASRPISIDVQGGTILGLAGLEGQGQVEFVECISGLRRPAAGRVVTTGGGTSTAVRGYRAANRQGIRYVPRDRRYEGLFGPLSVFDNFAVALWCDLNRGGLLRRQEARKRFAEFAQASRLVSYSPRRPISTLSGGNQQKVLLGRWISMRPGVLVVNDPLRGVDANTKEELYSLFRRLAAEGLAIIFLSTEIVELLTLTDQIAVFHEGSLVAMLPTDKSSDTDVVAAMFGDTERHADTEQHGSADD